MSRHTVAEVMTADVVTVTQGTAFKELAGLMAGRGISALPVLDPAGHIAGVVREADLLAKEEAMDDPLARRLPWWRRRARHAKAVGVTAREVMAPQAATIAPGASVVEAARTMDRARTGQLLVTGPGGQLAGILSRGDLMGVLARPDQDIRDEIMRDVITGYLRTNPALVHVQVADGVVTLSGEVTTKSAILAAVRMSRSVDGVVDVHDQLTFAVDDTRRRPSPDLINYRLTAGPTRGPRQV